MKKNIYDLTIEEFVRLLCGVPKIYEFDLTSIGKGLSFEQSIIKGDYWTLHNFFNQQLLEDEPIRSFAQGVLKELSNWFNYSLEYCITDIYDYLDYKTKGFEAERCKTVLFDMDYYLFIIKEEIEADGEEYKGQFTDYYAAISILKNKIGSMDINTESVKENKTNEKPNPNLDWDKNPDGIYTKRTWDKRQLERAKKYFKKALEQDYMCKTENGYKWTFGGNRGKIRLAYFLRKIFDPKGAETIHYKDLETLFGENRLDSSIRQLDDAKGTHEWRKEMDDNIFND